MERPRGLRAKRARSPSARAGRRDGAPRRPAVVLRRATLDDARTLAAIRRAAVLAVPRGTYPARDVRRWASLPALYDAWAMTAGGETIFVAEVGGRPAGFAGLRGAELTALFVRPRAARRGVGAALVARVARAARARGAARLRVAAALGAIPFYRRLGFAGGPAIRVPLPGGGAIPGARLSRDLRPSARPGRGLAPGRAKG